jgi:hypothetical protein
MNNLQKFFIVLVSSLLVNADVRAMEVKRFVELFNQRKMKELEAENNGYISPSLLKFERRIVRPLKVTSNKEVGKHVEGYLETLKALAKKRGEEIRENDLKEAQRVQQKLQAGWEVLPKVAREADVQLEFMEFAMKTPEGSFPAILVVLSSEKHVVLATPLHRFSRQADEKDWKTTGVDNSIARIKTLKANLKNKP